MPLGVSDIDEGRVMDIEKALEVANNATPGEWITLDGVNHPEAYVVSKEHGDVAMASDNAPFDARHIATFSPDQVIPLLEFVKAFDEWHEILDEGAPISMASIQAEGSFHDKLLEARRKIDAGD